MATEPTTGAGGGFTPPPEEEQADRVEDIGRAQQVSRDSVRQNERQMEENERHHVGEIMHAIHDEAETIGLESGDRFDHENRGVVASGLR